MSTDYTYQAALIVPAAQADAARRIAEAMGWGPGNYSCELTNGTDTFWGLSSVATDGFVAMMQDPSTVELSEGADSAQFSADMAEVMPALLQSIEPAGGRSQSEQFNALCAANGLSRVQGEET